MNAIARHDYMDSVWDVWLLDGAINVGHYRAAADGRWDAVMNACRMHGMSDSAARKIAGRL